jgi:hypothetical protein
LKRIALQTSKASRSSGRFLNAVFHLFRQR